MPTLYDNFSQVKQYIDQNQVDLSSYVSKSELSEMSYATTSQLPVIDENLIPKENNTYTLGSSTYKYKQVWANNLYGSLSGNIYNATNLIINLNNTAKYRISSNSIRPDSSNTSATLGTSDYNFGATYTSNIYADNAYISNYSNFLWTGTAAEYEALSDYTTYQIYMIKKS